GSKFVASLKKAKWIRYDKNGEEGTTLFIITDTTGPSGNVHSISPGCKNSVTWTVNNPDFAQWITNEKFDLIIHDSPLGQFAYGIAHEMRAKIIAFISTAVGLPDRRSA
ncbi:unnamed protein product, partial [Allacma fusca]